MEGKFAKQTATKTKYMNVLFLKNLVFLFGYGMN